MRTLYAFLMLFTALVVSCSRESGIKVNPDLKDSRFAMFVLTSRPDSLERFVDSIARVDTVHLADTIGFTVNDTVYLVGYKYKNGERVAKYAWFVQGKAAEAGRNGALHTTVFNTAGDYRVYFLAVDGDNGRDSTGYTQVIRVIDDPPQLRVLADTVWARHAGPAEVSVVAADSFGRVDSLRIDYQADGKWDTTLAYGSADTARFMVPKLQADSAGNQRVIVQVQDDDARTATDSLVVHFNLLPQLGLDYPYQASRVSNQERFAFYFHAADSDNQPNVRYFLRLHKSQDVSGRDTIPTDKDLILRDGAEPTFELQDKDLKFNAALDPSLQVYFRGTLFWQVWCTDGFDTVYSDIQRFYFGDLSQKYGIVSGFAKMQGQSLHSGIRVSLEDTSSGNRYYTSSAADGAYSFPAVDPGYYLLTATDTSGLGYPVAGLTDPVYVEIGGYRFLDTLWLIDDQKPKILLDQVPPDTIRDRNGADVVFFVGDYGSQVQPADIHIQLGAMDYSSSLVKTGRLWSVHLPSDLDGVQQVKIWATDGAGNSDTTKFLWVVKAKTAVLTVDGKSATIGAKEGAPLAFEAVFSNDAPPITAVQWAWTCDANVGLCPASGVVTSDLQNVTITSPNRKATLSLNLAETYFSVGKNYTMTVLADDGSGLPLATSIRFGVKANNAPSVIFLKPGRDTLVVAKRAVDFAVLGIEDVVGGTPITFSWACKLGASTEACPGTPGNVDNATMQWTTPGLRTVSVTATENGSSTASVLIDVHTYAPLVRFRYKDSLVVVKGKPISLEAIASDTVGTIADYAWKCGSGSWVSTATTAGYTATAPATATDSYVCQVQVTDDDGNTATAQTSVKVIGGEPKVTVATANATVTVKDTLRLQAIARDTLGGSIVSARWSCGAPGSGTPGTVGEYWIWPSQGKIDTLAIAPDTAAAKWLCVVEVEDDDGNTARDTTTFVVLSDPPTVTVVYPNLVKTIKDQVVLDAYASDVYGRVVKYEWSCGTAGVAGKGNWVVSAGTPRYTYTLPSAADPNFLCVIRVTDDDGQTAMDTTAIDVQLDPPTVTVATPNLTVAVGLNIPLNATAVDGMGYIVKREWSCARAGQTQWVTVSTYDTLWKAPASAYSDYMCIARATDDDGNMARDTIVVALTSEMPTIAAAPPIVYVKAGDPFEAGVAFNGPWTSYPETHWQCGTSAVLILPAGASTITLGGDLTQSGNDISCLITARIDDKNEATATAQIKVLKTSPSSVMSVEDSAFLWSGDVAVPDANKYFYSTAFHGKSSVPGTLGKAPYQYFWNFSNYEPDYWFLGNTDGTIDTSVYQFNEAFVRLQKEGSVTLRLQFRDSTPLEGESVQYLYDFNYRHMAPAVSKTVTFYRAWQNVRPNDTVSAYSTSAVPPAMVWSANAAYKGVAVAYADNAGLGKVQLADGTSLGDFGETVAMSLRMAADASNNELYVAYVNASGQAVVRKYNGSWNLVGTAQGSSVNRVSLAIDPVNHRPVIAYRTTANAMKVLAWSGSAWTDLGDAGGSGAAGRTIEIATASDGKLGAVFVGTGSDYKVYHRYWTLSGTSYTRASSYTTAWTAGDTALSCAFKGSDYYVLTPDRDNNGNPLLRKLSGSSWSSVGGSFGQRIGGFSSLAFTFDGDPVVAMDDRIWADQAQIHVWRYQGGAWKMMGENQLPYFGKTFRDSHGYYLRGSTPSLVLGEGKIYLGMRALEMAISAGQTLGNRNNGPLVQKYIGP